MKLNVIYPDLFFSICKFTPILVCIACTFGQWLSTSFGQYIPKNRSSRGVNPLEEVSGQHAACCSSCGHALLVPWIPVGHCKDHSSKATRQAATAFEHTGLRYHSCAMG